MANNTILFKTAIGSYDDFITSDIAVQSIPNVLVYGDTTSNQYPVLIPFDIWSKEIYRVLIRHFRNYEISYDNVDDFLDIFWERIEIHTPNFFQRKYYYNRLLQMTDEELLDNGEQISNYVAHNNVAVTDVFKKLPNITDQNQNKMLGGYAGKLRNQINSSQMSLIRDYCRKFEDLFLLIGCTSNYYG